MMTTEEFDRLTAQSEKTIQARMLCDSLHPDGVTRLTTMELTYPRFIHAEFMTHRVFSRNSASSRAIPMSKMIARIRDNPVFPLHWGKNQKGMQANEELSLEQKLNAATLWMRARDLALEGAELLEEAGIHKQLGNRVTETWMWITVIASATNWENMFALRCHPMAEPHFQNLAYKARAVYDASKPRQLYYGDWHLPLIGLAGDENIHSEFGPGDIARISAGRCARVSYLTHEGVRDPQEDIRLFNALATNKPMHASPLEHPAEILDINSAKAEICNGWGNFAPGFLQLRKMYPGECVKTRAESQAA